MQRIGYRSARSLMMIGVLAWASGWLPSTPAWPQQLEPPVAPTPLAAAPAPVPTPPVAGFEARHLETPVAGTPIGGNQGQASPKLVAGVQIIGNETTTKEFIQSQLRTKQDREFDPQIVQSDVHRLASTGRFRDVRTYTQDVPQGVIVTFEVFERPSINYIRYLGNRGISDKMLGKQDGLSVGESLNRYAVEEARRKIEDFYHSKGFSKTQVTILEGDKPSDRGVVFVINEGQLERIAAVKFVGNTIASDARLKTQIKSKPGFLWYLFRGQLDRDQIDQDVARLTSYYRNLGFFNARVSRELDFSDSGAWVTLTFVIDEGPRYAIRNVAVVGNRKFATDDLLASLNLKSGDYFDMGKLNRDIATLTDIYGAHGHIFADIEADPRFLEEPGRLDLVYTIEEGGAWRASDIIVHIEGDYPHTRQSVVLNRLSIRPGDIIDSREIRASERRLVASQLFANDPAHGQKPRVVIRPPELQESLESLASDHRGSGHPAYRDRLPRQTIAGSYAPEPRVPAASPVPAGQQTQYQEQQCQYEELPRNSAWAPPKAASAQSGQ